MNKFCPNCETETECTFNCEVYSCNECGEDYASYETNTKIAELQSELTRLTRRVRELEEQVDYYEKLTKGWVANSILKIDSAEQLKSLMFLADDLKPKGFTCGWCSANIGDLEEIKTHAVKCSESPLVKRIAELEGLLDKANACIGSVVACCTYGSEQSAKTGAYGISLDAFTKIDTYMRTISESNWLPLSQPTPCKVSKEEARKKISDIFARVLTERKEDYYLDGKYFRWGKLEKNIMEVIDNLLAEEGK